MYVLQTVLKSLPITCLRIMWKAKYWIWITKNRKRKRKLLLKNEEILWMVHFSMPVTQAMSIPFCKILDLQPSFYCPLCYNSRAHCPLMQCLHTASAILAGAYFYFVVSAFKCKGKNSCHDLIPKPCTRIYNWFQPLYVQLTNTWQQDRIRWLALCCIKSI